MCTPTAKHDPPAVACPAILQKHTTTPFPRIFFKVQICIPRRPVFTILGLQIQEAQRSLPEENRPFTNDATRDNKSIICVSQQGHLVSWKRPRRYCRLQRRVPEDAGLEPYTQVRKLLTNAKRKVWSTFPTTRIETKLKPTRQLTVGARRQLLEVPHL